MSLTTSAFALEESEVQSAIAASSATEVSGNIFIWLLCAVAFLKISQKIDSFLAGLGVNVGRTGGSMLAELMIAGRAIGTAAGAAGGVLGGIFNRGHNSSHVTANNTTQPAGQTFNGFGPAGIAMRAMGNAAAANATGRGSGLGSVIGGAAYAASSKAGGSFASDVVGAVATGNISSVGSMTGERASAALASYLGFGASTAARAAQAVSRNGSGTGSIHSSAAPYEASSTDGSVIASESPVSASDGNAPAGESIPMTPGEPVVTEDGGSVWSDGATDGSGSLGAEQQSAPIPSQPPTFSDVEIGGGRITGYETPAEGGDTRQFAMYHAAQYMEPADSFEKVQTSDGESWYKQYAQPVVKKTPFEEGGKIQYHEEIVQRMPQAPKRKDKV